MLGMCLAPLLLVGYAQSIQTSWHTSHDISGPYAQVQTCKDGLGAHVKVGQEWVTYGLQYGFTWHITERYSVTLQPQGGGSYSNTIHPHSGIRQITKFEGGVALMLSNGKMVMSAEYTHQSNGRGLDPTNAGQDLIGFQVGYSFK